MSNQGSKEPDLPRDEEERNTIILRYFVKNSDGVPVLHTTNLILPDDTDLSKFPSEMELDQKASMKLFRWLEMVVGQTTDADINSRPSEFSLEQ